MAEKHIADHGLTKTHVADANLEGNRFVKPVTATGIIAHVVYAGSGEVVLGVTRDKIDSGKLADIVYDGTAYVETSENIAAGELVSSDADGKAQVLAGVEYLCGVAVTDANSGEFVKVKLV